MRDSRGKPNVILKILGSAVAVAASVIAAGAAVSGEKRRLTQLQAFTSVVRRLGQQIEGFSSPVPEILKKTDPALLCACGAQVPDTKSFASFLDSCDLALSTQEKSVLFDFAADLGRKFRDEQVRSCTLCADRLDELSKNAELQLPKRRKVTYTLFICSALALVIILI